MLTWIRNVLLAMLMAMCASVALGAAPAAADRVCVEEGFVDGSIQCTKYAETGGPGTPGTPGGNDGSTSPPPCDLDGAGGTDYSDNDRGPNFCMGTNVCFTTGQVIPFKPPEGKPPKEDSVAKMDWCYDGIMGPPSLVRTYWSGQDDEPPSLLIQAQTAVAQLDFTAPAVGISPAGRTLVNLDTWFWAEGLQTKVTATAFTLVATADIKSMTVDPGDGTGPFACTPIATTAAEAQKSCLHEYRRSSRVGSAMVDGRPAFTATVTTVYGLTFTNGGEVIPIPGAPTTIEGPPATAAVRVDEVQTLSRPNR